ncbi:MAG: zinc metalloprotease HtpX, partial [Fusobacteria bacterium]|nr:zinc metalloprotease HtpX [Fusobacteriota bacterium]
MNTGTNFREVLKKNSRKTVIVLILFVLIYLIVGLIIDIVIQSSIYHGYYSVGTLFVNLVTFNIIPYATIIFCFVAIVSIAITLFFHNRIMMVGTEYKEITSDNQSTMLEKQIYNIVEEMKIAAGMQYMPKIYIINANYMNAFASGFSEKNAMIAITVGLAQKLSRDELQAVLAHELSHIRHGDIKLTIIASVLSNLMLMVIDMLFWSAIFSSNSRDNRDERGGNQLMLIVMILKFVLPLITVLLMLF